MKIHLKSLICSLGLSITTIGVAQAGQTNPLPKYLFGKTNQKKMQAWADSVYQTLSTEERLSQLIMPIIYPSSSPEQISLQERRVSTYRWGGILYQKGLLKEQSLMNQRLQSASKVPMLIALDGEWGLYMRLKDAPRFPRNMGLGCRGDDQLIYEYGREVARECQLMGIHINFAPTVDVNINPNNPVIGSRSFGDNPQTVSKLSVAYAMGLEDGGVLSVAKHFPGHGDTSEDSHHTLPTLSANKKRMQEVELAPFASYFSEGLGGVMTAHLRVPAYESEPIPSSLSQKIVTDLLQNQMKFGGLIFTDGLEMKGVQMAGRDIASLALLAGNDILLGPSNPEQTLRNLTEAYRTKLLPEELIREKCMKVLCYKYRLIISAPTPPAPAQKVEAQIWTPEAKLFAQRLWQSSLYFSQSDPKVLEGLKQNQYKRIAVLSIGKNPISAPPTLSMLPQGVRVSYIQYNRNVDLSNYDLVLANFFSNDTSALGAIQTALQGKPLISAYYTTIYKVPRVAFTRRAGQTSVIAFEACREAQEAVLSIIHRENKVGGAPSNAQGEDYDPTANMTPLSPSLQSPKTQKAQTETQGEELFRAKGIPNLKALSGIDRLVWESIQQGIFPGCQVLVMHRGNILYNKAFGSLTGSIDNVRVDKDTYYDLASVTKAIATTPALMLLVGQGKVNLDAPIGKYLSWLEGSAVASLRLRELLLHESGLKPSYHFVGDLWDKEADDFSSTYIAHTRDSIYSETFARDLYLNPKFKYQIRQQLKDLSIRRRGHYLYSDLNFILLQQVIESVSGESLDLYLEKNIYSKIGAKLYFNPLKHGLSLGQIAPSERDSKVRRQEVRGTVHDESAACLGGVSGNAGLFGTAEEVSKVCQLLLQHGKWQGKRIIPESTVKFFVETVGVGGKRNLGFDKPKTTNNPAADSASPLTYGHFGFTGTCFWVDPKAQLIFVFLSNRTYPNRSNNLLSRERIRPRLHQIVYDALGL